MRLDHIRVRGFGYLDGFDSGEEPLGAINVVVGPNESGKTTFFHLLGSTIYGLYPASRDQHPYAPWSGRDLDFEVDLRLDGGETCRVHRRLLTSPTGRLSRGDRVQDIRNQTLPFASHVTRDVFFQVFGLTLAEVATLRSEAWSDIQDRLLGAMGARDLVPARSAVNVLETEAHSLWRPHRRGKQEVRELDARIRQARASRHAAMDRDTGLRSAVAGLARARADLREAKVLRERQKLLVERTTRLLPIRKQLERASLLADEAGSPDALVTLPADPAGERGRLISDIAKQKDRSRRMHEEVQQAGAHARGFTEYHQRTLEARSDIVQIGGDVAGVEPTRARLAALEQEGQDRQRLVDAAARELFERELTGDDVRLLRQVVVRDLHDRVRDVLQVRDRSRDEEVRAALHRMIPPPSPWTLVMGIVLGLAASVLVLLFGDRTGALPLAVAVAVASAASIVRWWTVRSARRRGGIQTGEDRDDWAAGEGSHGAEVHLRALLEGLPLRGDVLTDVTHQLVTTVARLQELLVEVEVRKEESDRTRGAIDETRERLVELGRRLEIELPQVEPAAVHVLESKLREAERAKESSKAAGLELQRLQRREEELEGELASNIDELRILEETLLAFGDGQIESGIEAVSRMRKSGERADAIHEELRISHPDLDELLERIGDPEGSSEGPLGDEELSAARITLDELDERIETLTGNVKELQHECSDSGEATVAQIDGEIDALSGEREALKLEHDRKIVLAHLIRVADRQFREEHQPDVIRRASGYLSSITDGRYDRITMGDAGEFYVSGPCVSSVVDARHLSTGATEQLYVAIRLSIMDHLDEGRERLPVFIDEIFVNWDAERRGRGFEALRELSEIRQVFVMTCHVPWAEELVALGARRITLG